MAQTEGAELPELASKVSGNAGEFRERLIDFVLGQGIQIEFEESIAPALGMSYGGKIALLPGQGSAEEFSTLVHELAHEMLHKADRRTAIIKAVRETEAEAIAFVVGTAVGLSNERASADYIHLYHGNAARLRALRHVATIESIGSSTRIEGSKLTDREVERLLANLDIGSFAGRDQQEVAGYAEVMKTVFRAWEEIGPTENHIKQLPRLMAELIDWFADARKRRQLHPLLLIGVFTVIFLEIHSFQNGNGRLSRVLTTLLLLQSGYAYIPYSSLESVVEHSKEGYYLALRQTQATIRGPAPNWEPWLLFFLRSLDQQKRKLAAKIEREKIVMAALPALFDQARSHGRVTMGEMIRLTGASRNTLKEHLAALVEKRHLAQHGTGKGTWYALP